ncbi:MAG: NAD-dependent epimerase/dehydratase family protein [Flavipsychrobacter sp.]
MKLRVIITGTTGMVGKGVLYECLDSNNIEEVLIINRSTVGIKHPKLTEIIHKDFFDLSSVKKRLQGYDACFFCLGVSAVGMSEEQYTGLTYDLTIHFAETVVSPNMTFLYVSGTGTDSTEKGRSMWARVKGKTENKLLSMPFKKAYMFRPGVILPKKGIQSKTRWYNTMYKITRPLFPLLEKLPSVTDTARVGKAMINVALHGSDKIHLENRDINNIAS